MNSVCLGAFRAFPVLSACAEREVAGAEAKAAEIPGANTAAKLARRRPMRQRPLPTKPDDDSRVAADGLK